MIIHKYLNRFIVEGRASDNVYIEQALFSTFSFLYLLILINLLPLEAIALFYLANNIGYGVALVLKSFFLTPQMLLQSHNANIKPRVIFPITMHYCVSVVQIFVFLYLFFRSDDLILSIEVAFFLLSIICSETVRFANYSSKRTQRNIIGLLLLISMASLVEISAHYFDLSSGVELAILILIRAPIIVEFLWHSFKSLKFQKWHKIQNTSYLLASDSVVLRALSICALLYLTSVNIQVAGILALAYTFFCSVPMAFTSALTNTLTREFSHRFEVREYSRALIKIVSIYLLTFILLSYSGLVNHFVGFKLTHADFSLCFSFVILNIGGSIFQVALLPMMKFLNNKSFLVYRFVTSVSLTIIPYAVFARHSLYIILIYVLAVMSLIILSFLRILRKLSLSVPAKR
jgi:hypothetical protein